MAAEAEELLSFWFGAARRDPVEMGQANRRWFGADPELDRELEHRFGALWRQACAGELDGWRQSPSGRLALILLLDQLSRNLARGTAAAFAQDEKAARLTLEGLARGLDRGLSPSERMFLLMPLQHAEDADLQERSVMEFSLLLEESPPPWREALKQALAYAEEHRDIVLRFGRFPHRNRVLGRESTPEERAFLEAGAASYGQ